MASRYFGMPTPVNISFYCILTSASLPYVGSTLNGASLRLLGNSQDDY